MTACMEHQAPGNPLTFTGIRTDIDTYKQTNKHVKTKGFLLPPLPKTILNILSKISRKPLGWPKFLNWMNGLPNQSGVMAEVVCFQRETKFSDDLHGRGDGEIQQPMAPGAQERKEIPSASGFPKKVIWRPVCSWFSASPFLCPCRVISDLFCSPGCP